MNDLLSNISEKPIGYYDGTRDDMLKYIPEGVKKSLDLGCGTGGFSSLLREKLNIETWAIEINEKAAEKAASKLDKVIFGDATESLTKIPDNYFDCIILFDIIEHLNDPYTMLNSIKTKLSDTGVVVASIPNIRYYRTFIQLVIHGNWDYKDQGVLDRTHLRFFTKKSIVKMFNSLNYSIIKMEGIHPTSSKNFRILNAILLNFIADVKFKHFVIVAQPR